MTKKPRKKINRFKLIIIISSLVIVLLVLLKPSWARYVYNGIKNYYYESKNFYFNSKKLSEEGTTLQLDNWDGVNYFDIDYEINSFKNNSVASTSAISYDIIKHKCTTEANVTCTITKETGLIPTNTHKDSFTIRVNPNQALSQGDTVTVEVEVKSTDPYEKVIKGTVVLNVGVPGIAYEISDKANRPYLDFKITNTVNYYKVVTPFGDYGQYATIQESVYEALSAENKAKCTSAVISLSFDPSVILVDVTSDFYENAYSYTTQIINGKSYINGIIFGMDPVSSMTIRFYKVNATNNYTYPTDDNNNSPIITFNAL